MRSLRVWLAHFRGLFGKECRDRDLAAELESHLQLHIEDNLRAGMTPEEARRRALIQLGGVEQTKERYRERRGLASLESLVQDLRFALRMLRKNPGFTAVAVLTLALGIGANTAIFSLIDAVLLRSLPVENPSQLFVLTWAARRAPMIHGYMSAGDCPTNLRPGGLNPSGCSLSEPMFRRIAQARVFADVAAFGDTGSIGAGSLDLTGGGGARVITGQVVSGQFFRTLGVKVAAGRLIQQSDDSPSAASVAVLNYGYWESAFGGSLEVIGRTIELNRVPFTIVGVAEQRFTGLTPGTEYDIWLPLADAQRIVDPFLWQNRQDDPGAWWLTVVARLDAKTPRPRAQAAVSAIFRNEMLHASTPLFHAGSGPPAHWSQGAAASASPHQPMSLSGPDDNPTLTLENAQAGLTGGRTQYYSRPLYTLMAAVAIILLIACVNVAGLMLTRSTERQREVAVRLALGARRTRIIRQLLTESVMLSTLGGAFGILFAYWGAHAILSFVSANQPRPLGFAMSVDARLLAFTMVVSLGAGILFGMAPAFRGVRIDLTPALKEGRPGLLGDVQPASRWFSSENTLVVVQVALAIVVLVGAGLLVRTLQNLRSVDPGFDPHNIVLFRIDPTLAGYKDDQIDSFYRDLQGRLAETPGVASASYSSVPLLSNGIMVAAFHWPGTSQDRVSEASLLFVGRDFFRTMQIPFLQGRDFDDSDYATSSFGAPSTAPTPVVVNQAFVAKYLGAESPLDKRFGESAGRSGENPFAPPSAGYRIVGVVRDAKYTNLRQEISPTMYVPQNRMGATFELRTAADPKALLPAIRRTVAALNPNLPLSNVTTQEAQIDRLLFQERLVARLSVFFGLLALTLACIGLYGLLSYEVVRRTREIGIRMALGATGGKVLRRILTRGLTLCIVGGLLGVGGALGAARYLKSMLFGVQPSDPSTIIGVAVLLALVAFAACYIPAQRAMRVDPMEALRYE
jgi:macrolide transport system ATP-binding/permease protein